MIKIADWLGIPFHENLLEVTLCGKSWEGNSSTGRLLNNIDKSRIGHGRTMITDQEYKYISNKLKGVSQHFSYD